MMRAEGFYDWHEQPRQGDILLCGISRVIAEDRHSPPQWEALDAHVVEIDGACNGERSLDIAAGIGLAMVVSPLVDPAELRADPGKLRAGRVIGYLPVPTHPDELVEECVVDLTYQCTIDRLDVVKVAAISEPARKQLRYALIQLDALRTADLGFEVEAVVGRTIQKVEVPVRDPLSVRIQLDDGQVIQLLQQPGSPDQNAGRSGEFFASGGPS